MTANLGISVGHYIGELSANFIPRPSELEADRQLALQRWGETTKWVPNEISHFHRLRVPIDYEGLVYRTIEHFYQALKSKNPDYRKVIAECETPNKTKYYAGKLKYRGELREDWNKIKLDIMTFAERHRIETDPVFADWLRSTRHRYLTEWVNWSNSSGYYWGRSIYTGEGQNASGRILMTLRDTVYWKR